MITYKFSKVFATVKNSNHPSRAPLVVKKPDFYKRYPDFDAMNAQAMAEALDRFQAISVDYQVDAVPSQHTKEYNKAILDAYKWTMALEANGDKLEVVISGTHKHNPLDYINAPLKLSFTLSAEGHDIGDAWFEIEVLGSILFFNLYNSEYSDGGGFGPWSCGAVYWVHPDKGIQDEILEDYKSVKVSTTKEARRLLRNKHKAIKGF